MLKMGDNSVVFFGCTGHCALATQMPPHAYPEWKGCLCGSFPRLDAYAGALRGFLCWMVMHLANDGESA